MSIITNVAQALQRILGPISLQAGINSQLIRRHSQHSRLDGATFVQTLVFGWLANPQSSLQELAATATTFGVRITPQGLAQRFTNKAAQCLREVLQAAAKTILTKDGTTNNTTLSLLSRFKGVFVQDSSVVSLPVELAQRWPGCGGGGGAPGGITAALKLHVRLDLRSGQLDGPFITSGKTHDRETSLLPEELPEGSLWMADLGFFKLEWLQAMNRRGIYWLTRVQAGTLVATSGSRRDPAMSMQELLHQLRQGSHPASVLSSLSLFRVGARSGWEMEVFLGTHKRVATRLLILPVPLEVAAQRREGLLHQAQRKCKPASQERLALCDWTILATNVPASKLKIGEALVLYRLRWQIERLFRLWKEVGQIDDWRSSDPERIECEVLAKMLGQVVQHWTMLCGCWEEADHSLHHAAQVIRKHILFLGLNLTRLRHLKQALRIIGGSLKHCGRIQKRKRAPASFQLLADPPEFGYA